MRSRPASCVPKTGKVSLYPTLTTSRFVILIRASYRTCLGDVIPSERCKTLNLSKMTLLRTNRLKSLKGKAIILSTIPAPPASIQAIRDRFPDLELILHVVPWGSKELPFDEKEWADTDVLLTATVLPTIEQAPNIKYVQLTSAGANHIIGNPFFKDTKIPFSTANGVHG